MPAGRGRPSGIKRALGRIDSNCLGDVALLSLEFFLDIAVGTFRRVLRSKTPCNRITAAAALARYPGLRETIRKYREAELPDCPECGSGETAQVIVGVIGRTMLLAGATKKVHLRANDKPGEHYCNDCESYF